jgi:hypothetical protein
MRVYAYQLLHRSVVDAIEKAEAAKAAGAHHGLHYDIIVARPSLIMSVQLAMFPYSPQDADAVSIISPWPELGRGGGYGPDGKPVQSLTARFWRRMVDAMLVPYGGARGPVAAPNDWPQYGPTLFDAM